MTVELWWSLHLPPMRLRGVSAVWCHWPKAKFSQDSQTYVLFADGQRMSWWGVKDVEEVSG